MSIPNLKAKAVAKSGSDIFLNILKDEGIKHIFGNPGTTELPLMDSLVDYPDLQYILGLQEAAVVGMADGYSRATGQLCCVNMHAAPGLGNAIGSLYNAHFFGSPIIVTAGQQEHGFGLTEPKLYNDLVAMAAPVSKWAVEVPRVEDLPLILRRAAKVALTPPTGPVFISLPHNVLSEISEIEDSASIRVDSATRPSDKVLNSLASRLLSAESPLIVASHDVAGRNVLQELALVAEIIGAPVYSDTGQYAAVFNTEHPLFMGCLPRSQSKVRDLLEKHDVLFMVGGDGLRMSTPSTVSSVPPNIDIIELSNNDWNLAKNNPAIMAIDADVKVTLSALKNTLQELGTPLQAERTLVRSKSISKNNWTAARLLAETQIESFSNQDFIAPEWLCMQVVNALPDNGVIVNEAITSARSLLKLLPIKEHQRYFGEASGGIGWGLSAAIGVQLALPKRPVVALIGDGSALYTCQSLWTAAHYHLPITYIITNNGGYNILKNRLTALREGTRKALPMIAMDLSNPSINYTSLANSMGVSAKAITQPDELIDALKWAFNSNEPTLLDVRVSSSEST